MKKARKLEIWYIGPAFSDTATEIAVLDVTTYDVVERIEIHAPDTYESLKQQLKLKYEI